jgi:predicted nucleic-acid-binding protein
MKIKLKSTYNFEAWQIPYDKDSEQTREIPKWIIELLTDDELILIDSTDRTMAKVKTYYGWLPANQGDYLIRSDSGLIFVCPEMEFNNIFDTVDG